MDSYGAAMQVVDYVYDTQNRWIGRTLDPDGAGEESAETTNFVYDGNQILLQLDSAGNLTHRYLWGPMVDQILADEQVTSPSTAGEVLWPLTDHLGTVRDLAVYDAPQQATTIANHRVYDSFGTVESQTNAAVDLLFGFTGRPFDEATGLQNNLNRHYDPNVGRWLSEDPIGYDGADGSLYRYVANQSTRAADPVGLYKRFTIQVFIGHSGDVLDAAQAASNAVDGPTADGLIAGIACSGQQHMAPKVKVRDIQEALRAKGYKVVPREFKVQYSNGAIGNIGLPRLPLYFQEPHDDPINVDYFRNAQGTPDGYILPGNLKREWLAEAKWRKEISSHRDAAFAEWGDIHDLTVMAFVQSLLDIAMYQIESGNWPQATTEFRRVGYPRPPYTIDDLLASVDRFSPGSDLPVLNVTPYGNFKWERPDNDTLLITVQKCDANCMQFFSTTLRWGQFKVQRKGR